ncbi:hypothetical protein [Paucibacter sp. Y2R2-4]|uniref:hypothetical protein n=1 Tax=Paucibacter sp. Y2R2-4 TaxID=2893553 RepID=UPI0021E3A21E|nr:hypothetical protein [Paucibacter sp. Y2R2-4]MCV2351458.1 hypothetical protein [Paucibacter sp. Y2R2-4]
MSDPVRQGELPPAPTPLPLRGEWPCAVMAQLSLELRQRLPWLFRLKLAPQYKKIVALLMSALFVASAVHLLGPVLNPLESPAQLALRLASTHLNGASDPNADLSKRLLVLKIDRQTFLAKASPQSHQQFNGTSPLDRCVLRNYLQATLEAIPDLEVLGIDVDLSPTGLAGQDGCAEEILDLLSKKEKLKSVLILPVEKQDREEHRFWPGYLRSKGLHVAHPDLLLEFGLVRRHLEVSDGYRNLGAEMHWARFVPEKKYIRPTASCTCNDEQGLPLPREGRQCKYANANLKCEPETAPVDGDAKHERNIAFHLIAHRLAVPEKDPVSGKIKPLWEQLQRPGIKKVHWAILGADYDRSDSFRTPLGEVSGVEVHATIAVEPDEEHWKWLSFAIDVLLGMLFGYVVHHIWTHYFERRLDLHTPKYPDSAQRAYLILIGLGLLWLLLALLALPALSVTALLWGGIWINPVPMLIGMSLDAFVVGSVKVSLELMKKKAQPGAAAPQVGHPPPTPDSRPCWLRLWHGVLNNAPMACWVLVLAQALEHLAHGN